MDLSRLNEAAGDLASSLAQAIVLPFEGWRRARQKRRSLRAHHADKSASSTVPLRAPRGYLVAIGGGNVVDEIVVRMIHLAGGRGAVIRVVPTAAADPEKAAMRYSRYFARFGTTDVKAVPIHERADALDPDLIEQLESADLVFLGGGDQSRLKSIVGGTPAEIAIHQVYHRGGVVAGTSAGASILGTHMPISGDGPGALLIGEFSDATNESDGLEDAGAPLRLGAGFGLIPELFIDQHFVQRNRFGRLVYAITHLTSSNSDVIGLGLDESTAAIVRPDRRLEIVGDRVAMIVDAHTMSHCSLERQESDFRRLPLSVFDLTVHVLHEGQWFDLENRRPLDAEPVAAILRGADGN